MTTQVIIPYGCSPDSALMKESPAGDTVRRYADSRREDFFRAAALIDRLEADGWAVHADKYSTVARHPEVRTEEEAYRRLTAAGVAPDDVHVSSFGDEDVDDGPDWQASVFLPFAPWHPGRTLEDGGRIEERDVRRLFAWQRRVAVTARRLLADNWKVRYHNSGLEAEHPDLTTRESVLERLAALGIRRAWLGVDGGFPPEGSEPDGEG